MKNVIALMALILAAFLVVEKATAVPAFGDGYWITSEKRGPAPEEAYRELEAMFGNMQRPRFGRSIKRQTEQAAE